MVSYLLKLLYLVVSSFVVIATYYLWYSFHVESFVWYTPYIISMLIIYILYKAYNLFFYNEVLKFKPISIFWFFLLHLFILSFLFFSLNWIQTWYWISLFFKIIWYMILPIFTIFTCISFWKFVLGKINKFKEESQIFQFLFSLWFWFFSFVTFLTILGFFWFYNLYSLLLIFLVFLWVSYKDFLNLLKWIFTYQVEIKNHSIKWDVFEKINLHLLSSEFLFIVLTFLLSVNLINIVRPMPIGWDDLWVYMNYPQLLANAWEILPLGQMLSWQIFTWIWYMFKSATQSFFFNNVWWFLSVLVIILAFFDLLKNKTKTFINIPLLASTIFVSMPMVIFQQAKDMKLDPGLFFISSIIVYLLIYLFLKYFENKHEDIFSWRNYLIYFFIIWILAWFTFSIKVTSLLLISWIIWIFFFSKLWLSWFFAYILAFIWIFTKFGLWSLMNVVYPKDDMEFRNWVFIWSIVLSIWFLAYAFKKYWLISFKRLFVIFWIFLVWIITSLLPWFAKNITTIDDWNISIGRIINWKSQSFIPDYTKIYSETELETIKDNISQLAVNSSWTTTNEDFWRYFWYEKWINNYVKLPYNLTMQENQTWEYTDITYIYLAIIPVIILFLWFSSSIAAWWYFIISLVPFLFFFAWNINDALWISLIPNFNAFLTNVFSNISLPEWYLYIWALFLLPFIYFIYLLDNSHKSILFRLNLVFVSFYTFLWTISAFWVVWYWIVMYFSLLLIIWIWLSYLSWYEDNEEFKLKTFKLFWSFITLLLICFYFFSSSFPHGFNNLKSAWYESFKAWLKPAYITIFESHPDYYKVLLDLNIKDEKKDELYNLLISKISDNALKNIASQNTTNLLTLEQLLSEIPSLTQENSWLSQNQLSILMNSSQKLRNELYFNVLYPNDEFKNESWVYRIWTFLKYFITNNQKRLLEDNLINTFDNYFYEEWNINKWIERMKNIWVDYFLVDLNAATIDKDPRKDLTRRYENLLKTFTSNEIELISSDSLCLKTALETYNKSQKTQDDLDKYILNAWVNYESYDENWKLKYKRQEKQIMCYNSILTLIQEDKINENNYSFLLPIKNYIAQNWVDSEEKLLEFFSQYISHWWMALFKIK